MTEQDTIEWLKTLTPEQLLREANKGFKVRDIDLNLIRELQQSGFSETVINVLFHYVLSRSKGLRFDVIREIASSWVELGVNTMEQASELAIEENIKWQERIKEQRRLTREKYLIDGDW